MKRFYSISGDTGAAQKNIVKQCTWEWFSMWSEPVYSFRDKSIGEHLICVVKTIVMYVIFLLLLVVFY